MAGITSKCGNRMKGIRIGYLIMAEQTAFGRGILGSLYLTFPKKNKGGDQNC